MRRLILIGALTAAAASGCRHSAPRPSVLLVTVDTFRADRLTSALTPALDRLTASGMRFTAARSAVPLTLPSHTTIHTGLLPPAHGVHRNGVDRLDASTPTIASVLSGAGYRTAAFVGAFVLDHRFGLAQGFSTYDDDIPRDPNATDRLEAERPASAVIDRAIAWLKTADRPPDSPFFVWVHLYDPHAPYVPHGEGSGVDSRPLLYDGEIAYVDTQISRLFLALRASGRLDRTLVIVSGDHGEGLGDHRERTHGLLLYDSTLRVPLIVAGPGVRPARRDDAVGLADIAPTVLRAAGLQPATGMQGRDLLAPPMAGLIAADQGRDGDAAVEFTRAASLDPANASYWVNLGNAKRALHDGAAAADAYRRALGIDPRAVDAANGLGVLLVEANRPADAATWFERALAGSPGFVEARLNLGIALQQAGDAGHAADAYRAVLAARGSHAREKQAAAHLLASLGAAR